MALRFLGKASATAMSSSEDSKTAKPTVETNGSGFALDFNVAPACSTTQYVDVAIQPPAGIHRRPCDIVCVVDVSGSMSSLASIPDEKGECDNLSRLDLVKHAVRTVIAALKPTDNVAVVSFSSDTKVRVPFTKMDAKGKVAATKAVDAMQTEGATYMWPGIQRGLEIATARAKSGRTSAVFVLTDGEPTDSNHMQQLDQFIASKPGMLRQVSLSTFGFGYSLKSELLDQISASCNGMYTFVPDASIVGTAFVNNLSNVLATAQQGVEVSVAGKNGAVVTGIVGRYPHKDGTVKIGASLYGQTRNVVVQVDTRQHKGQGPILEASVVSEEYRVSGQVPNKAGDAARAMEQAHRLTFGTMLNVSPSGGGRTALAARTKELLAQIKQSPAAGNANTKALTEDLAGQVTEAVSKDEWFRKWGMHYLPSLCRSHMLQQCSNFKDPGLQVYGGTIFHDIRTEADDIFVSLPAPKPSVRARAGQRVAAVNMSRYYNCSGGCFLGACTVSMAPGVPDKQVRDIRKGDRVLSANGQMATVRCVVETLSKTGVEQMVTLPGGLVITPYHPVRHASLTTTTTATNMNAATSKGSSKDAAWAFPIQLGEAKPVPCTSYFTFVLESGHTAFISGTECVGLGHGFDQDVVRHPYLGSQQVVADLQAFGGFEAGHVQLAQACYIRNPQTMQIHRLAPATSTAATATATAAASTCTAQLQASAIATRMPHAVGTTA